MKNLEFSLQRFWSIVKKEIQQLRRDKISSRIPLIMPIGMMLLFGYVVNTEVDYIATAVFDQSQTQESRAYIDQFRGSGYFMMTHICNSEAELELLLDNGSVKAALLIQPDFALEVKRGRNPEALLLIDGSDATIARTVLSSGVLIGQQYALQLQERRLALGGGGSLNLEDLAMNTRVLYNPNLDLRNYTIPGLVGLIMQSVTVMLTAFAMVREKERGTIEQLIVTPIKPNELILGKLTPYIFLGYAGFLFSLAICCFYFKVAIVGDVLTLLTLGGLFVICSLSIGMLVSTFAQNQLQAMMAVIIVLLPSIMLSGFMYPIEAMPTWAQPISQFIPLTYFLRISRGIILKGSGIELLLQDSMALVLFMVVILTTAILRFKKNLD